MKDINKYCSTETARLLSEIADYRGEWDWVKISTFNYINFAVFFYAYLPKKSLCTR